MTRTRRLFCGFLTIVCILQLNCAIKPHFEYNSEECHKIIPLAQSNSLTEYDPSLAGTWENTYCYCFQIKENLAGEIEGRKKNLFVRRFIMLSVGSLAGLASSIYAGVTDQPKAEVLVPLGVISGTSLTTALPVFFQDERLEYLQEKLDKIKFYEINAIATLNKLETKIQEQSILYARLDEFENYDQYADDPERVIFYPKINTVQAEELRTYYLNLETELQDLSNDFRAVLTAWKDECH